jgi:hypothetical protein
MGAALSSAFNSCPLECLFLACLWNNPAVAHLVLVWPSRYAPRRRGFFSGTEFCLGFEFRRVFVLHHARNIAKALLETADEMA